jgi:hypothetical protein
MSLTKRLSAASAAVVAALAIALPATAANAAVPSVDLPNPLAPNPNLCLSGVADLGPFGPMGPYGAAGPYGPSGPLHGQTNPIGNAAQCGGLLTYVLRGGTLSSFVQTSIAPFQH